MTSTVIILSHTVYTKMHKLFYSSACDYIMSMSTFLAVVYIVGSYHDFNVTCTLFAYPEKFVIQY